MRQLKVTYHYSYYQHQLHDQRNHDNLWIDQTIRPHTDANDPNYAMDSLLMDSRICMGAEKNELYYLTMHGHVIKNDYLIL